MKLSVLLYKLLIDKSRFTAEMIVSVLFDLVFYVQNVRINIIHNSFHDV